MKKIYFGIIALFGVLTFNAQGPQTSICVATVDSASNHNIVVWERADQTSAVDIDSMYIYRRDLAGIDVLIDVVDYDSLSEYHDMDTIGANPNSSSSLYRIAGKDINGIVGPMSSPVETIFLDYVYSGGIFTLSWTPYVGASFTNYVCWDEEPTQANSLIQTPGTVWDFTAIVPGQLYEFVVDITDMTGCTSTKANHNTSRSNRRAGGVMLPTSVNENNIVGFKLSPNPADTDLNISFNSRKMSDSKLVVYNLLGEIVLQVPEATYLGSQKLSLDVSNLNSGLYLVTLQNDNTTKTLRFSKK